VHGQAISAAVDLRRADFYELAELRIEPGLIDLGLQGSHSLKRGRTYFADVNSLLHRDPTMACVAALAHCAQKLPAV